MNPIRARSSHREMAKQVAPALLLLGLSLLQTQGPLQALLSGLWIFAAACAVLHSLIYLARGKLTRELIVGRAIILIGAVLLRAEVELSLREAQEFADQAAAKVQTACQVDGGCPRHIDGWKVDTCSSTTREGWLLVWPMKYLTDGEAFVIQIYRAPDIYDVWTGGYGERLEPMKSVFDGPPDFNSRCSS